MTTFASFDAADLKKFAALLDYAWQHHVEAEAAATDVEDRQRHNNHRFAAAELLAAVEDAEQALADQAHFTVFWSHRQHLTLGEARDAYRNRPGE